MPGVRHRGPVEPRKLDPAYAIVVESMYGLGDTIYQRPFLRALAATWGEIFVRNPWPELLVDLPGVRVCYPAVLDFHSLRTQRKNAARWAQWSHAPPRANTISPIYMLHDRNVLEELETHLPLNGQPFVFDLPSFERPAQISRIKKPIAVIRPVTFRKEWLNLARPPEPIYIAQACDILNERGYHTINVADIAEHHESAPEPLPGAATNFLRGELDVPALLGLIQAADVVVGGVGWIVPACIAARTPLVVIAGGQGFFNCPEKITDRRMDTSAVRWVFPEPYCMCMERLHKCSKTISDFPQKFARALDELVQEDAAA